MLHLLALVLAVLFLASLQGGVLALTPSHLWEKLYTTLGLDGRMLPAQTRQAAEELFKVGYTVLAKPLPSALVAKAAASTQTRLARLLAAVEMHEGCSATETTYSMRELMHRGYKRWDVRVQGIEPWWPEHEELVKHVLKLVNPVLNELQPMYRRPVVEPRLDQSGVVVSRPGAVIQDAHADGERHVRPGQIIALFVPLVDIERDGDGTEFWNGSHIRDQNGRPQGGRSPAERLRPALAAGSIILYDFKTVHKGLANPAGGRERPLLYLTIAADLSAHDENNFPSELPSAYDGAAASACMPIDQFKDNRPYTQWAVP